MVKRESVESMKAEMIQGRIRRLEEQIRCCIAAQGVETGRPHCTRAFAGIGEMDAVSDYLLYHKELLRRGIPHQAIKEVEVWLKAERTHEKKVYTCAMSL